MTTAKVKMEDAMGRKTSTEKTITVRFQTKYPDERALYHAIVKQGQDAYRQPWRHVHFLLSVIYGTVPPPANWSDLPLARAFTAPPERRCAELAEEEQELQRQITGRQRALKDVRQELRAFRVVVEQANATTAGPPRPHLRVVEKGS